MKSRIVKEFKEDKIEHVSTKKSVFYLVDYTEKTNSKRAVEVLETFPTDIDPLIIHNPTISDTTISIFKPQCFMDKGIEQKQCEGVMYLTSGTPESWIVFIEIKDCKPSNAAKYHKEIKDKIITNVKLFREKGIIPPNKVVYAIASFPRKNKTNFHNQLIKAPESKQIREKYKVMIKGANEIKIKNNSKIV